MVVISVSPTQHFATVSAGIVLRDEMFTLNVLLDVT